MGVKKEEIRKALSTSKNFDTVLAIISICKASFWMARKYLMTEKAIKKIFCNACKQETRHFVQAEYQKEDELDEKFRSYIQHILIV